MDDGGDDLGPEPGGEGAQHAQNLRNEDPVILSSAFSSVTQFLETYGWFLLLGGVCLYVLWSKLQPRLARRQQQREEAQYKKLDSGTLLARQEAMDAARRRLQEQHDAQAREHAQKQAQLEEQKRKQKIEEWDKLQQGKGYHSKYRSKDEESANSSSTLGKPKPKNVYRQTDYSPLAGGGGGGACYRPDRRTGAGGG